MGALARIEVEDSFDLSADEAKVPAPVGVEAGDGSEIEGQLELFHMTGEGFAVSAFHPLAGPQATD